MLSSRLHLTFGTTSFSKHSIAFSTILQFRSRSRISAQETRDESTDEPPAKRQKSEFRRLMSLSSSRTQSATTHQLKSRKTKTSGFQRVTLSSLPSRGRRSGFTATSLRGNPKCSAIYSVSLRPLAPTLKIRWMDAP